MVKNNLTKLLEQIELLTIHPKSHDKSKEGISLLHSAASTPLGLSERSAAVRRLHSSTKADCCAALVMTSNPSPIQKRLLATI